MYTNRIEGVKMRKKPNSVNPEARSQDSGGTGGEFSTTNPDKRHRDECTRKGWNQNAMRGYGRLGQFADLCSYLGIFAANGMGGAPPRRGRRGKREDGGWRMEDGREGIADCGSENANPDKRHRDAARMDTDFQHGGNPDRRHRDAARITRSREEIRGRV